MKLLRYIIALIITLSVCIIAVRCSDGEKRVIPSTEIPDAQNASYDFTEPLQKIDTLTADLAAKIDRMDEIIREYERISEENRTFSAQLHDFGEVMDEVGKMEQEGYMEGHK